MGIRDPDLVQLGLETEPAFGLDGDGQMVESAEHFGVGPEVQPGQVEERNGVAVAEVEEEVGGSAVVAVLEHVGQRKLEDTLVELDSALHVAADQGHVMDAASRR